MLKEIYSIYDQKTRAYDAPISAENHDTAKRFFKRVLENVPAMGDFSQDFDLYHIGSQNSETGEIAPTTVQFIINGLNCHQPKIKGNDDGKPEQNPKVSNDAPIQPST